MEAKDVFPLCSLVPELQVQVFSHLPGRDLLHVKLVSKHFNSLVPVVYSFRGRNNLDKVILIQQWWKDFGKKRLDACAEQFDTRKLVVDECLMITESVFDSKKRALACREELLAFLHEKEGKEKEKGTKKKGFLFGRKKKEDVFTVENVETIFHLPLLTSQVECLSELVEGLRQAAESYSDATQKTKKQRCCWAVVRFFKKIPAILEAYMDYLGKADVAALLFDGPLSKKEDYPDFWRIVATHFCFPNEPLEHFRIVMRLGIPLGWYCKWPLLLRELGRYTPRYHPDRPALTRAQKMVEEFVQDLNNTSRGRQSAAVFGRLCLD